MGKKSKKRYSLVYSSEFGAACPVCGKALKECQCRGKNPAPADDGIVRLSLETKGRKGRGVTLARGLALKGEALQKLLKELKQKCACGGTLKGAAIEIQGDHRQRLERELKEKGYRVKICGG